MWMYSMIAKNNSGGPDTRSGVFSAQISEDGLLILRGLIGRQLYRVLAPCLQVAGAHFTAPSFSIHFSDEIGGKWFHKYVNIRCEWSETPLTFTDYWEILISSDNKPSGIDVDSSGAIVAPCTICFYKAKPIKKIEIYEFQWSDGEGDDLEAVTYDKAIRFQHEDGTAFCIACQLNGPGDATEVHISEDETTVRQFLEDSRLRVCLTAI
jgi:hypothetical protein